MELPLKINSSRYYLHQNMWEAGSSFISQALFIKLLALSYLFAFFSLSQQVKGLFGSQGIVPIQEYVGHIQKKFARKTFYYLPSLFLYRSDDRTLQWAANGGVVLSLVAFLGVMPSLCFILLWFFYLSFIKVGAPFLQFQWDTLLLEVGFVGIFVALVKPLPFLILIWLWILVFRFIFASGAVKWLSKCPEWHALKAMSYHFETQPLPNLGGYFAHHLLRPFSRLSCFFVFVFEVAVPFLYFGTPLMRVTGTLLSIFFQFLIIITGNYAFFNLLTIALCLPLIDDQYLSWLPTFASYFQAVPSSSILNAILNGVGLFMILTNALMLLEQMTPIRLFQKLINLLMHFNIMNHYGLFAVMTTVRNEIIIEGSLDGIAWKEYDFKYKPQALGKGPQQIAPLQPRLDWQMWFAALSSYRFEWWFHRFILRLLENSPVVLALLKNNPFPDKPPLYIRAEFYRYRFSSLQEWWATGHYWTRTYEGLYMPPSTLKD